MSWCLTSICTQGCLVLSPAPPVCRMSLSHSPLSIRPYLLVAMLNANTLWLWRKWISFSLKSLSIFFLANSLAQVKERLVYHTCSQTFPLLKLCSLQAGAFFFVLFFKGSENICFGAYYQCFNDHNIIIFSFKSSKKSLDKSFIN